MTTIFFETKPNLFWDEFAIWDELGIWDEYAIWDELFFLRFWLHYFCGASLLKMSYGFKKPLVVGSSPGAQ